MFYIFRVSIKYIKVKAYKEEIRIGLYFDSKNSENWNWKDYYLGNIGMNGTYSQSLLLVTDLSKYYNLYFFINAAEKESTGFTTIQVTNLADAAFQAKRNGIDLLICNNRDDNETLIGLNKLSILEQPFILWDQNGPRKQYEELLSTNSYLKRIVCVSKTHANSHRHRLYFDKVSFIYNGKDYPFIPKTINKSKTDIKIAFLGAITVNKGFHWVTMSWAKIRREFPNITLTVIGSIKTHDWNRKTGKLGIAEPEFEENYIIPYFGNSHEEILSNGVIFTGHISPNEMYKLVEGFDLGIVNPNVKGYSYETFCVSAIDFQACHLPVIGGNAGGLRETVKEGITGILINKSNKLADVIIKTLKNRKKLYELKENCNPWIKKNFSREKVTEEWRKLIENIIHDKPIKRLPLRFEDVTVKLIFRELIRYYNQLRKK